MRLMCKAETNMTVFLDTIGLSTAELDIGQIKLRCIIHFKKFKLVKATAHILHKKFLRRQQITRWRNTYLKMKSDHAILICTLFAIN